MAENTFYGIYSYEDAYKCNLCMDKHKNVKSIVFEMGNFNVSYFQNN